MPARRLGFRVAELMGARTRELRRLSRIPRAFCVRPARPSDEALLSEFMGSPAKTRRLLASGDGGFLALAEERVQAMEWSRPGPAEYAWDLKELGVVFKVPPRFCWLHNGDGRGAGLLGPWAMILGRLPDLLEERGIEAAGLQVSADNRYSIQCHESLGFRKVGRVVSFGVGGLRMVRIQAGKQSVLRFRRADLALDRLPL